MTEEYEGVSEEQWEKWRLGLAEDDLVPTNKVLADLEHNISILLLAPLGKGVSGCVYACKIVQFEHNTNLIGQICAAKIFKRSEIAMAQADNETLVLTFAQRSIKTAVPTLYSKCGFSGHTTLLQELGGPNIQLLTSLRRQKPYNLPFVRSFLHKLLMSLSEMEKRGLVHGDIKPENIVISLRKLNLRSFTAYKTVLSQLSKNFMSENPETCDILICDWSSSSIGFQQNAPYMQSRFYRAPEVIMRGRYGPSVDIWSAGCIAAEMCIGEVLFPGTDELDMLQLIQKMLGVLPNSVIKLIGEDSVTKRSENWLLEGKKYLPGTFEVFMRERCGRNDFEMLTCINLLRQMLQLNPDARISASSALLHPFITGSVLPMPGRAKKRKMSLVA